MYSIRVFSFSGDIYHEVILPGSAHVREILSGTVASGNPKVCGCFGFSMRFALL